MQTNANNLLDQFIERNQLKNDAAMCRMLGVEPPMISKLRHGHTAFGPHLAILLLVRGDMSLDDLRQALGDETPAWLLPKEA